MPPELSTVDVTNSRGRREDGYFAVLESVSEEIAGLILPWSQSSLPIGARRSGPESQVSTELLSRERDVRRRGGNKGTYKMKTFMDEYGQSMSRPYREASRQ
jgi:hypothetical protein